jgi:hypothetical protein
MSTVSAVLPEVDSRLTHPPNFGMQDIARFWGEFLNIALPINWYLQFIMSMAAPAGRSD